MANIDLKRGKGAGGEEDGGCFVVVVVCLKDATDPKSKKRGRGGERKIDMPIKMHEIRTLR